jgi:hypothetical protein
VSTHPYQRVPTGKPYRPIPSVRMASSFSNLSFLDFLIAVGLAATLQSGAPLRSA